MSTHELVTPRSQQTPFVDLPNIPGIGAIFARDPLVGNAARELAQALLVTDNPGVSLTRAEREMIAAYVSGLNGCQYCTVSHSSFVTELLRREEPSFNSEPLIIALQTNALNGVEKIDDRMRALLNIAAKVQKGGMENSEEDVEAAIRNGATEGDVFRTVQIAAAFCMYNRMVDGVRAVTPQDPAVYAAGAVRIVDSGYITPSPQR